MDEIQNLKNEIKALKKKITIYEISTKLDYEKIEKLKQEIETLKKSNSQTTSNQPRE